MTTAAETTTLEARRPHPLDERWYYYQNPASGQVNSTPLSVRQLCKLLCPVREGMKPILPSHTQCLLYQQPQEQQEESSGESKPNTEWKMASTIDILKESSASQWYVTTGDGNSSTQTTTKGPMSCRGLVSHIIKNSKEESKRQMVYETTILPEWTLVSKLDNLQWAVKALTNEDIKQQQEKNSSRSVEPSKSNTARDQEFQDELEAFLSSTEAAQDAANNDGSEEPADNTQETQQRNNGSSNNNDDEDQEYESDGGTKYIKDPISGNWIHEALIDPTSYSSSTKKKGNDENFESNDDDSKKSSKKKKHHKAQFAKRNAKNWIYVTGLPTTNLGPAEAHVTSENVAKFFGKVGLIDLDPENLKPKIKLYKDKDLVGGGQMIIKGDASICYAHPQSVELALQILDESLWYDNKSKISVQRAKFEAKKEDGGGETKDNKSKTKRKKVHVSEAKRKVAKLALRQAQDEGFGGRLSGGRKGLCIIVIKNLMDGIPENKLESVIYGKLEEFGTIEKITVIESTKVVIIKFVEPTAASEAVSALNDSTNQANINKSTNRPIQAMYWDGVTDYTHQHGDEERAQKEEEQRHDEFGKWLEETQQEELPEELRLRVES